MSCQRHPPGSSHCTNPPRDSYSAECLPHAGELQSLRLLSVPKGSLRVSTKLCEASEAWPSRHSRKLGHTKRDSALSAEQISSWRSGLALYCVPKPSEAGTVALLDSNAKQILLAALLKLRCMKQLSLRKTGGAAERSCKECKCTISDLSKRAVWRETTARHMPQNPG